eukprot:588155-Pyramimonas_sp.AAC.1
MARQCMPASQMECWLEQGWADHQMRRWYSLRQVKRDDAGNVLRSKAGPTKPQGKMIKRDFKKGIIEDRKLYRG